MLLAMTETGAATTLAVHVDALLRWSSLEPSWRWVTHTWQQPPVAACEQNGAALCMAAGQGVKRHTLFRGAKLPRGGWGDMLLKNCCIPRIFFCLSQDNVLVGLRAVGFRSAAVHCSKALLKHAAFLELVQCGVELFPVVNSEHEKFIPQSSDVPSGM